MKQQTKADTASQMTGHKRQFIAALSGMLITLGLIVVGFLSGFIYVTPAYARGNTEITCSDPSLNITFLSVSSNDPGRKVDQGMDKHVGRCTARVRDGIVDFSITHGYPGYQCSLVFKLKNQGTEEAIFQGVQLEPQPGLQVNLDFLPTGSMLKPGQKISGEVAIVVTSQAEENAEYPVLIEMLFDGSLNE